MVHKEKIVDLRGTGTFEEKWVFDNCLLGSGGDVQKNLFWHWPGLLSDDICDLIIKEGKQLALVEGGVNTPIDETAHKREIKEDLRRSRMAFFSLQHWVTGICHYYGHLANQYAWHFDLGVSEPIQFSHYRIGDHYTWHVDLMPNLHTANMWSIVKDDGYDPQWYEKKQRKLSLTVNLSDPTEYYGGDVEFLGMMGGVVNNPDLRKRGTVIAFPSFVKHRVTKITGGERFSLVVWIVGEPFK